MRSSTAAASVSAFIWKTETMRDAAGLTNWKLSATMSLANRGGVGKLARMPIAPDILEKAVAKKELLPAAAQNIHRLLEGASSDVSVDAIGELAASGAWDELNDRFYKTLAFGTGGLRGRTIGKIVTRAEQGSAPNAHPPEFPCVGTNAMNYYNVARATRGLVAYLQEWFVREKLAGKPKIVIAHDTRYFSKEFTALAAQIAAENGADACIFDAPRSTPELSFAVRHLRANAGIVITASHNPPHDNGYKVYFDDGAQVVEPHASGIIAQVNKGTDATAG